METTTIRVREPRELLALLPYQLGFHPQESAVAVALRPPRGRVGLIARVDIDDLADPGLGPGLGRRLVTHLVGDGAARAVLVLYTRRDPRPRGGPPTVPAGAPPGPSAGAPPNPSGGRARAVPGPVAPVQGPASAAEPPEQAAVRHFRDAAAGFLGEVAVWVVGPDGYLSLDCTDPGCCPPGGRPLRELQSTAVGAHMVLAGAMVADSRDTLVPDLPAPSSARRNALRAAVRAAARRSTAGALHPDAIASWRAEALRAWRVQLAGARVGRPAPAAADTGRLMAALDDVQVRDAVLLTLVGATGDLPERSLAAAGDEALGAEVAGALAAVVSPREGVPPDEATLAAATTVLERVVAHAAGAQRAPALTLLGLLAWWRGDGARAAVLLGRALHADRGHRLAQLLTDALGAGVAPGWVRARG